MSESSSQNGPATAMAVIMGIILIAVGAVGVANSSTETEYTIDWNAVVAASNNDTVVMGEDSTVNLVTPMAYHSAIIVDFPMCDDAARVIDQPAQMSFTLTRTVGSATEDLGTGTVVCTDSADERTFRLDVRERPDLGLVVAESAEDAETLLHDDFPKDASVAYELIVTASRADTAPIPLPTGDPGFSGSARLQFEAWSPAFSIPEEVIR